MTIMRLVPMVSITNTTATSKANMDTERTKAASITTTRIEKLDTKVRAITNGLTMLGTNGAQITIGIHKRPLIINGATTQARST